jgi:hypothetical protein
LGAGRHALADVRNGQQKLRGLSVLMLHEWITRQMTLKDARIARADGAPPLVRKET